MNPSNALSSSFASRHLYKGTVHRGCVCAVCTLTHTTGVPACACISEMPRQPALQHNPACTCICRTINACTHPSPLTQVTRPQHITSPPPPACAAEMDTADDKQILVRFVSKLPAELRVPEAPVAIPTTLKRYGLSQIINHMLGLGEPLFLASSLPCVYPPQTMHV